MFDVKRFETGQRVRILETTQYDAPEFTTESNDWDGNYFGGREGTAYNDFRSESGKAIAVAVDGVEPGIDGRGWTFLVEDVEAI